MGTAILENATDVVDTLKRDLINAEAEVSRIRKLLNHYGAMPFKIETNIHWRNSIRNCLIGKGVNAFLMTSAAIVDCVCFVNSVDADRNIKTKISSSLGLMFNLKEIGRVPNPKNEREFMYGLKQYFKDDLTTLKDEYVGLIDGGTIPLSM